MNLYSEELFPENDEYPHQFGLSCLCMPRTVEIDGVVYLMHEFIGTPLEMEEE